MEKLKQWIALSLLASLGIVAVGWFVLVSPKRSEAAALRTEAADQLSANGLLATQIEVLKSQATELPEQQATLAAVAAKIPDNTALPGLVRALVDASTKAGVELVSITPGTPVAAVAAVPAAATPVEGQAAPAPAAAPVASAAGQLANIPVSISIVGDYFEVSTFLAQLETLPRALRVNDLTVAPGLSPTDTGDKDPAAATDGSHLTTTINGFVFMAAGSAPTTTAPAPAVGAASVVTPPVVKN